MFLMWEEKSTDISKRIRQRELYTVSVNAFSETYLTVRQDKSMLRLIA